MFHVNEGFWIDGYWRHDLDFPEYTNIEARFYVTEQIVLHEIKGGISESRTVSKVLFYTNLDKYNLASMFATLSMRGETENSYNEALAFLLKQKDTPSEFERECDDADKIMVALGMTVEQARTEGGSLNLPKILARIAEGQAREQQLREAYYKLPKRIAEYAFGSKEHEGAISLGSAYLCVERAFSRDGIEPDAALSLPQDDTALRQYVRSEQAKLLREIVPQMEYNGCGWTSEHELRRKAAELREGK